MTSHNHRLDKLVKLYTEIHSCNKCNIGKDPRKVNRIPEQRATSAEILPKYY